MSDFADYVLKALTEHGMLKTRINKETKQQELAISEFGEEVYMVLNYFVEKKK